MDSNKPSEPKEITSARVRTESECSLTNDEGGSTSGKRQRTTSQTFMVTSGITAASPPKFVSLEEIMQAANGMKDMALVHQIVVDQDFKLQKYEPEDGTLHKMVKDNMHKAFWDYLKEQLAEDPPNYSQALTLLEEIKESLFGLLLPQHTKVKQQIAEVLDSDLIKQQVENGTLDFRHYAQYVISVMLKLCAPIRDEKIKALAEITDVVETFKGILEILSLMALDMANFTIQMAKPEIIAHSVELERKKFADFLSVQSGDGLSETRKWLLKHLDVTAVPPNEERISFIKNLTKRTFTLACIDLLEWNNKEYPETFMLDITRLQDLQLRVYRVIVIGTILLVTASNVGPHLQSIASFKKTIKDHVSIIMQSVNNDNELEEVLPNIFMQLMKDIKEALEQHKLPEFREESELLLKEQISYIIQSEHRIRALVKQRVKEFFLQIIQSATAAPEKVPSGLTALQQELAAIAGQFLKIVSHNSTVFCIYYYDIVHDALPNSS